MRHDKKDGLSIDIPGTFTSATGAGADPGTSFKVYLFPAGSETATVNGADLDKVGAIVGVYSYTWDITNVAVGQYFGYIMAVDTAISYPSAIEYDITDSRATETQIDTISTSIGLATGSGMFEEVFHFQDDAGSPESMLLVWLTLDSAGIIPFTDRVRTNSGGNFTFKIDKNVTYYKWTEKSITSVGTYIKL